MLRQRLIDSPIVAGVNSGSFGSSDEPRLRPIRRIGRQSQFLDQFFVSSQTAEITGRGPHQERLANGAAQVAVGIDGAGLVEKLVLAVMRTGEHWRE